jgi:hypothetical protein
MSQGAVNRKTRVKINLILLSLLILNKLFDQGDAAGNRRLLFVEFDDIVISGHG